MSPRAVDAHRPRSRSGLVLLAVTLFVLSVLLQYAGAMSPQSAFAAGDCNSFAIFTTDAAGNTNNQNQYDSKPEVYLNGGPSTAGGGLSAGTTIYYQVQTPEGAPLMEIRSTVIGPNGTFKVQLFPFNDTTNSGGEYKVVASTQADLGEGGCTKSDNFKVAGPGSLKITKAVEGGPSDFTGTFHVTADCGASGSFDGTIHFPDPGFVLITGIDSKAQCHVSEGTLPAAPDGFHWGDPTFSGNLATIESDKTVTVGVTNHLEVTPAPALTISKGVSLSADGPFAPNLNATVGTTVHYRITITNTGNVALSGVTLVDNHFDLATKCADPIPTTLAVGASYDCNYTDVAADGTTTNIATADSAETDQVSATATVTGSAAREGTIDISKGVSLSADGPFTSNLTTTVGTTVHYRILVTNTGDVDLTGVTLVDTKFDLATQCANPIPTTLAVGATYECDYTNVATEGTTTNIAIADSDQTGPFADSATVVATTATGVSLTVNKTNAAPLVNGLPTANEGDVVAFDLAYAVTGGTAHNATIVDTLPTGLTYVTGSATNSASFMFQGYDANARTLTWTAASVDADGSVGYQAKVDAGAAALAQPLENVVVIDSDETGPNISSSVVFVAPPVLGETAPPQGGKTAPPTDAASSVTDAQPGGSLPLILGLLAVLAMGTVLMVTPAPSSLKGRRRRD